MSSIPELVKHGREQMDKAVESTHRELGTIRSGKASPALLDLVRVEAYGAQVPLNQVAMVAAPEPRLLTVQPFDKGAGARHREGHPRRQPRPQSGLAGQPDPGAAAGPVRGAPQGPGQGRAQAGRGRPHRRAPRAHRHAQQDQEAGARPRGRPTRAEKDVQKHTDEHVKKIDEMIKAKEAEIMEV